MQTKHFQLGTGKSLKSTSRLPQSIITIFFSFLLESLCNVLYETFRPLVIHMTHMETLAEMCNILKVGQAIVLCHQITVVTRLGFIV